MIRLGLRREPYWLDLGHGVRVKVRPLTTALMKAVQADFAGHPGADDPASGRAEVFLGLLARHAILEWDGVGDEKGEPAPVTHENVEALMRLWPIAEAFERLYLAPALLLEDEKNA